jgi:hypothetical protein
VTLSQAPARQTEEGWHARRGDKDRDIVSQPGPEDLCFGVVRGMIYDGVLLTRENVITRAYMMGDPGEWTAELEASLPPMFR